MLVNPMHPAVIVVFCGVGRKTFESLKKNKLSPTNL